MIDQGYGEISGLKNKVVEDIISCGLQDESGLNDFQKLPTQDLIAIPKVGISRFRLPVKMKSSEGELRSHDATANMYVSLDANKNGVSMSRLCSILQTEALELAVDRHFFKKIIGRYREELIDDKENDKIADAQLSLSFNYPVRQKSLKSDNWGWQYYPVTMQGKYSEDKGIELFIKMTYEYSSTCPCSLSMAKQYERDFAAGKTSAGSGIGVPHSQRSKLNLTAKINPDKDISIEELLFMLKEAIPTETQSLVKRQDEQAFAILNGAHPMFVEHATKRVYKVLNANEDKVLDWLVELEHIESLHSHNAAAVIFKGIQNGLRADSIFV